MDEWIKPAQAIIDWIEQNIDKNPTLLDMSKQVGYSPYYCSTQFHRITGITIRAYIMQRKLYHAAMEIKNTGNRIIDIAVKYGYSSHEALTKAFKTAFGLTPRDYRNNDILITLPFKQNVFNTEKYNKGVSFMLTDASVRVEYIPAHKYLGVYGKSSTTNGEIWAGHDCDETTDIVQNMAIYADAIITAHTAGWIENGKTYFYGLGLPLDYNGEIPEGFKLRELPGSYYLVFSHPPFEYPKNNGEVMRIVEEKAWNFDPKSMGFEWNENECQDYQRHYPEGLGYQVLRSVRRINK